MKHTLYVSDLDGTLLRSDGTLSPYTVKAVCDLQDRGALITCASGRSLPSVRKVWRGIPLRCPVIAGNGVSIHSLAEGAYLHVFPLDRRDMAAVGDILRKQRCTGFLYTICEQVEWMFYQAAGDVLSEREREYLRARRENYPGRCGELRHLSALPPRHTPLYITLYGEREVLEGVNRELEKHPTLHGLYSQRADEPLLYYLDIVPAAVSKSAAVRQLARMVGAREIVAFGDHLNDRDMMLAADRSYAPANAVPQIKEIADGILGHCDTDAVVRFIQEDFLSRGL